MRQIASVFLAALLILGWNAGRGGIASAYVDPLVHIQAQDEATYAASSFEMVRHGGWLTPRFLGRYALYKPPLYYWLSALCAKVTGTNAWAIRMPPVIAGAGTIALVFAWLQGTVPLAIALTGPILLLSSHLFFILSRTGLMDALLVFEITLAMFAVSRDRGLGSMKWRWIFGIATGSAIMTKAVAGLLPIFILVCSGVSLARLMQVSAIAAAVALPWHLWQIYAHPRWFWAEYVLGEHLTWGFAAPEQTTPESHVVYSGKRLFALDPVLILGFAGLVSSSIRGAVRRRQLVAWTVVILVTVLGWRYRNVTYLAPLYPALALSVAAAIPKHRARLALAFSAGLFLAKVALPSQPFGIPFTAESTNLSHVPLAAYGELRRSNELIMIGADDQFYAATLDLPRVRYVWLSPTAPRARLPLDFESLGITMSAADFARLDELRPIFAARLRQWNLDSADPIGTVILAQTDAEIQALIEAHPQTDFYIDRRIRFSAK